MAQAGKHIWIEKPVGLTTHDARAVADAVHERAAGGEPGPVENEDYVSSLLRLPSGARVVLEASRIAVGEQNSYGFEIHGTKDAVFWDFRRMNEREPPLTGLDSSATRPSTPSWSPAPMPPMPP